jgi:hypothetical protein
MVPHTTRRLIGVLEEFGMGSKALERDIKCLSGTWSFRIVTLTEKYSVMRTSIFQLPV